MTQTEVKTTHKKVAAEIRQYVKEWTSDGSTAEDINGGYCADFASILYDRLKWPSNYKWGNCYLMGAGHTWVIVDGKHYDAECPDGVDDWKNLPFFLRYPPDFSNPNLEVEID